MSVYEREDREQRRKEMFVSVLRFLHVHMCVHCLVTTFLCLGASNKWQTEQKALAGLLVHGKSQRDKIGTVLLTGHVTSRSARAKNVFLRG